MAMLPNNIYEFSSLSNAIDFVKPLIIEGYPVVIQRAHNESPLYVCANYETYQVDVGPKDEEIKVYFPNEKAENNGND